MTYERNVNGTYTVSDTVTLTMSKEHDKTMLWCIVNYRYPLLPRTALFLNLTCKFIHILNLSSSYQYRIVLYVNTLE